jgi:Lon protease-like protein
MMQETIAIDFRLAYPLFPLPGTVLLPNTILPLHVFEERYRRMVRDTLDSHGFMAISMFKFDVSDDDYQNGKPELRPVTGFGQIVRYERLDGGRYVIFLQGVCRAEIVEETPHQGGYRTARVMPFDYEKFEDASLDEERSLILSLLETRIDADVLRDLIPAFDHGMPTKVMVDQLCDILCTNTEQKYALLREPEARARAHWLIRKLEHDWSPQG